MYYLSILAQFKNESLNLKLWIDHYLWQGVQHFYLIDNGSTDNPMSILKPYIDKRLVTYYYIPKKYSQIENYRYVFDKANIRMTSHWLIIADLDEFFYGVDHKLATKVRQLNNYNVIYCNWLNFGTSGCKKHPKDIRISNIHRHPKLHHVNTKYIFKPKSIISSSQIWIHWLVTPKSQTAIRYGRDIRQANKLIRLHHYVCQSEEFFEKVKSKRGDATAPITKWTKKFFDDHNRPATFVDETLKNLVENPPPDY
jgi:hypothetical protein